MKIVCNKYLTCTNISCEHKNPHSHMEFCDRDCDGINDSKCLPTLKMIREEKLKRLNKNELRL